MAVVFFLLAPAALAQGVALTEGESVLSSCMLDEGCGAYWTQQLAETLLETGIAFSPSPIVTSALGMKGMGAVVEVAIDTTALGPGNELSERWTPPPFVPRVAVGYQIGSYTYDDPYPQFAVGVHLLPPLEIAGLRVVSGGLTGSVAAPVRSWLWVGADVDVTASRATVPLLQTTDSLASLEQLTDFLGEEVECEDTCEDRLTQIAQSTRLGLSLEPFPAAFAWVRLGATAMVDTLRLDVDDTTWRLTAVVPSIDTGGGVRLGDRYQVSGGVTAALKPPGAVSTRPHMFKMVVSMGFRFGAERYWEGREDATVPL